MTVISFKNFAGRKFGDSPLVDIEFRDCMFAARQPFTEVFPPGSKGLVFTRCNLTNVVVPQDSQVDGLSNTQNFEECVEIIDGEAVVVFYSLVKDEKGTIVKSDPAWTEKLGGA